MSHQVVREIREYERASTILASAYVKPIAAVYLAALARELARIGIAAPLLLMLSGGAYRCGGSQPQPCADRSNPDRRQGRSAAAFFGARDGVTTCSPFDLARRCASSSGSVRLPSARIRSLTPSRRLRGTSGAGFSMPIS